MSRSAPRPSMMSLLSLACWLPCCGDAADGSIAPPSSSAPDAGSSASTSGSTSAPAKDRPFDEIQPLYPKDGKPPDPLAERTCEALHGVPAKRRAACCEGAPRAPFQQECVRTLSHAIRSSALKVDEAQLARCEEATKQLHDGCGWVGIIPTRPPVECMDLFKGQLPASSKCRSNLECSDGLTCYGLSAIDPGKCASPPPNGVACGGATDALAGLTRQDDFEIKHPVCAGICFERRCTDAVAIGDPCKSAPTCGSGRTCVAGKCSGQPLPVEGAACASGACAAGLRCVEDRCVRPGLEGAACAVDAACFGACEQGKCVKRCLASKPMDTTITGRPGARSASPSSRPAPRSK